MGKDEQVEELERILSALPDEPIHVKFDINHYEPPEGVLAQVGLSKYLKNVVKPGTTTKISMKLSKKEVIEVYQKERENVVEHDKNRLVVPSMMMRDLVTKGESYEIKIYPVFSEAYMSVWGQTIPAFQDAFLKALRTNEYSVRWECGKLQHPDHT